MSAAKYSLGRVHSKYLILEILSYRSYQRQVGLMLHLTSRAMRKLVTENFDAFKSITVIDVNEEECDIYELSRLYQVVKIPTRKGCHANRAQFFIHKDQDVLDLVSLMKLGFPKKQLTKQITIDLTEQLYKQDTLSMFAEVIRPLGIPVKIILDSRHLENLQIYFSAIQEVVKTIEIVNNKDESDIKTILSEQLMQIQVDNLVISNGKSETIVPLYLQQLLSCVAQPKKSMIIESILILTDQGTQQSYEQFLVIMKSIMSLQKLHISIFQYHENIINMLLELKIKDIKINDGCVILQSGNNDITSIISLKLQRQSFYSHQFFNAFTIYRLQHLTVDLSYNFETEQNLMLSSSGNLMQNDYVAHKKNIQKVLQAKKLPFLKRFSLKLPQRGFYENHLMFIIQILRASSEALRQIDIEGEKYFSMSYQDDSEQFFENFREDLRGIQASNVCIKLVKGDYLCYSHVMYQPSNIKFLNILFSDFVSEIDILDITHGPYIQNLFKNCDDFTKIEKIRGKLFSDDFVSFYSQFTGLKTLVLENAHETSTLQPSLLHLLNTGLPHLTTLSLTYFALPKLLSSLTRTFTNLEIVASRTEPVTLHTVKNLVQVATERVSLKFQESYQTPGCLLNVKKTHKEVASDSKRVGQSQFDLKLVPQDLSQMIEIVKKSSLREFEVTLFGMDYFYDSTDQKAPRMESRMADILAQVNGLGRVPGEQQDFRDDEVQAGRTDSKRLSVREKKKRHCLVF